MNIHFRSLSLGLVAALASISLASISSATEQMPNTFLVKENGEWILWSGYVNGWSIIIEDESKGTRRELEVRKLLPKEEFRKRVTTAGPRWGQYALAYFTQLEGRPVLRIRTRYYTDIVIDPEAAKVIAAQPFKKQLRERDEAEIKRRLTSAKTVMNSDDLNIGQAHDVHAAIFHAAELKLREVAPLIQSVEDVQYIGAGILPNGTFTKQPFKSGSWSYTWYETRDLASLALRQLGVKPKGYAPIAFVRSDSQVLSNAMDRDARVGIIKPTQEPFSVYKALGPPDGITYEFWRYDIDTTKPYSVEVFWNKEGLVDRVVRKVPAAWQVDFNGLIP